MNVRLMPWLCVAMALLICGMVLGMAKTIQDQRAMMHGLILQHEMERRAIIRPLPAPPLRTVEI